MIGLMTFHAAHNYGSVLQAYATQNTLDRLGYENEIINYRLPNQKQFYNHLYSTWFGFKNFIKRNLYIPYHKKRMIRSKKFENFINQHLRLTTQEYNTYYQLLNAKLDYPILISGSDQVWNIHCGAEFYREPPESILGYYLAFGRDEAKRIAFSSSLGTMTKIEISKYLPYLKRYNALGVREQEGAKLLSEILGRNIENTLDPTLMLNSNEWAIEGTYSVNYDYIFVYTLQGFKSVQKLLKQVIKLGKSIKLPVICVSPISPVYIPGVKVFADCGPLDFLSYIRNATLVITDTFHGTAFSVNMEKPFYSIKKDQSLDNRREQLLSKVGLSERLIKLDDLVKIQNYSCNFSHSREILEKERYFSLDYLKKALNENN